MKLEHVGKLVRVVYEDIFNENSTFKLVQLLSKPRDFPVYDSSDIPSNWIIDRYAFSYLSLLFPDDKGFLKKIGLTHGIDKRQVYHPAGSSKPTFSYSTLRDIEWHREDKEWDRLKGVAIEQPRTRFGGIENFFSPSSMVLDLGSGCGVALSQFCQASRNRNIVWAGVDSRYSGGKLDFRYTMGPQFLHADLTKLESIPDASINRIMDVQAALLYNDPKNIAEVLTRVSKKGAILRSFPTKLLVLDDILNKVVHSFTERGWDVYTHGAVSLIARKN